MRFETPPRIDQLVTSLLPQRHDPEHGPLVQNLIVTLAAVLNCEDGLVRMMTRSFVRLEALPQDAIDRTVTNLLHAAVPIRKEHAIPAHPPYFTLADLRAAASDLVDEEDDLARALARNLVRAIEVLDQIDHAAKRFYHPKSFAPLKGVPYETIEPLVRALDAALVPVPAFAAT